MTSSSTANQKRTLGTLRKNNQKTKSSRTKTQIREMLFLQETHTVPRTPNLGRRNSTVTGEIGKHSQNASTKKSERSETIFRTSGILKKVCTKICRHFQSTNTPHQEGC